MPRPNYVVAWNTLKDIITTLSAVDIHSVDPSTILSLMLTIEHTNIDWSNLYEILQYLKSPTSR